MICDNLRQSHEETYRRTNDFVPQLPRQTRFCEYRPKSSNDSCFFLSINHACIQMLYKKFLFHWSLLALILQILRFPYFLFAFQSSGESDSSVLAWLFSYYYLCVLWINCVLQVTCDNTLDLLQIGSPQESRNTLVAYFFHKHCCLGRKLMEKQDGNYDDNVGLLFVLVLSFALVVISQPILMLWCSSSLFKSRSCWMMQLQSVLPFYCE